MDQGKDRQGLGIGHERKGVKRDIIERLRDDWERDSAASVPDAISEIQRLRKEVGRLKNEAHIAQCVAKGMDRIRAAEQDGGKA